MKKYFLISALIVCITGFAQPTISSFSPASGSVGTTVTITGTNFSSVAAENIVFFGGVRAIVNAATATSLNVTIPAGAGYTPISVTTNRLTAYSKLPFNVTFTNAGTPITTASFTANNVALTTNQGSAIADVDAVVFADIDGDGKPDMITARKMDSTISVSRNISSGGGVSFESKVTYKIGSRPRFIIAGDINGDGKQDIISANISIANSEDASFTVLINKSVSGQVSMTAQKKNVSRGTFPGMSLGDFDLDGKPDVMLASMDSSQLVIYGNASSADSVKFNTEKKISLPFPPEYVINADLDGDGKTDLLMTRSGDSSLYVAKNTSASGVFSFSSPLNIGFASLSMSYNPFTIADFNNDGKPDIAFPNLLSGKAMIFKNTSVSGDISFTGVWNFPVGNKPLTLAAGDLTGDGLPDLIVNNAASATMSVLKNASTAGSFTFDTKFDFPVSNTGNTTDAIAAIADIDMNGAYDFVGYNANLNGFLVYQNKLLTSQPSSIVVSSFTPASGKQGDTITIKGKAFATASEVRFGGVFAASFAIVSDSLIKAVVGNGKTGAVRVTATSSTDSLAGFIFTAIAPKITGITPNSGTTGDTIRISGTKLTGVTAVSFSGIPAASFILASDSLIKAVVGTGASGLVRVSTPAGTDSLPGFTYLFLSNAPKITGFTPSSGGTGTSVAIKGQRLTGAIAVSFGGVTAAFTVVSDTLINAVVGSGASGFVNVKTSLGSDSLSGFVFSIPEINLLDSTKNKLSFNTLKGAYSTAQYFVIGGKRMQSNITIAAPPYFQVSRNADTGYSSVLSVTPVNSTVDSTKIYVRFKVDSITTTTGNISLASTNAVTKNVTVSGSACDSAILTTASITGIIKDSTICIRDSVTLIAAGTYNIYKWSTGDSLKTITVKKSANVSLQVGSKLGCLSNVSPIVRVIKDSNAVPILGLTGDTTLISSNANNYRWYFNNVLVTGNTSNKLIAKKIGFYGVETSNDKICWTRSNDYPIVMIPTPLVNDTAAVKTYPNPATGGTFNVVVTLQRATNVVARVTVTDVTGVILLQTNKFIFFGREIKIPITLNTAFKGTAFVKVDINGDIKTQTVILQ